MERKRSMKRKILNERGYFLFEVLIVFFGSIFFLIIPTLLLPMLLGEDSIFYAPIYFIIKAFFIVFFIPISIYITDSLLKDRYGNSRRPEDITPAKGYIKLFNVSKKNAKYQLMYGIIFLFILFIPLDFFTYLLVPKVIEYQAAVLTSSSLGNYFSESYSIFLISAVIIHISVAIVEESLARGLITKRGSEHFNKVSAVIIASIYFGLSNFAFFMNSISLDFPIGISIILFVESFIVGIILSMFIIRKKWILPLIFANALNKIISAQAIWNYQQGSPFFTVAIIIYLPLLTVSFVIFILQFSRIKEGLSSGIKIFNKYFKNDLKHEEQTSDKFLRIIIDIVLGLLIFILGLILI